MSSNTAQSQDKLSRSARIRKNLPGAGALGFAIFLSSALKTVLLVNGVVFLDYLSPTGFLCVLWIIQITVLLILFFLARKMNAVIFAFPNESVKWSLFLVVDFVFPFSVFLLTFLFLEYLKFF